jgi:tRNA (cmo5U34)-methyltransferase
MPKDKLFRKKRSAEDFNFGKKTAQVFDDMLDRSVPFYSEVQHMINQMVGDFAVEGTNVYDLGCSTGTTFIHMKGNVPKGVTLVGVDSSPEMLAQAKAKLAQHLSGVKYKLVCADLNKPFEIKNASVAILNLTLQFIRPLYRDRTIATIAKGLKPGGALILVEKVLSPHSTINRLFIKNYYEFKKQNGYSQMEIAQKREALENVLIPYHFDENRELLLRNGFKACDIFFRWYNFCGILALK